MARLFVKTLACARKISGNEKALKAFIAFTAKELKRFVFYL